MGLADDDRWRAEIETRDATRRNVGEEKRWIAFLRAEGRYGEAVDREASLLAAVGAEAMSSPLARRGRPTKTEEPDPPNSDAEKLAAWARSLADVSLPLLEIAPPRLSLDGHMAMQREFGPHVDLSESWRENLLRAVVKLQRSLMRGKPAPEARRAVQFAIAEAFCGLSGRTPAFSNARYRGHRRDAEATELRDGGTGFIEIVRAVEVACRLPEFSLLAKADWGDFPNIFRKIN